MLLRPFKILKAPIHEAACLLTADEVMQLANKWDTSHCASWSPRHRDWTVRYFKWGKTRTFSQTSARL